MENISIDIKFLKQVNILDVKDPMAATSDFSCNMYRRALKLSLSSLKQRKAEQKENQWLLLNLSDNWDYRANCHPEIQRDRQIKRVTVKNCLLGAGATGTINV